MRRSATARLAAGSAVELSCTAATFKGALPPASGARAPGRRYGHPNRLTGQSTPQSITTAAARTAPGAAGPPRPEPLPRRAPAEALALRGRVQRGADGLRRARAGRSGAPVLLGGVSARGGSLRERTRLLPRRSALQLDRAAASDGGEAFPRRAGGVRIRDAGVQLDLRLAEEAGFPARCRHGRQAGWTRKQAGIAASGTLALDGAAPRR